MAALEVAGQPDDRPVTGDQPRRATTPIAASAFKGIEMAAVEVAAQSRSDGLSSPDEGEVRCLAVGIYFEARGESIEGQLAVAQVILNRVASDAYPDTICGVVYQNDHRRNGCQFSFACDGKDDAITEHAKFEQIKGYAAWILASGIRAHAGSPFVLASLGTSTHYHSDYVSPGWAKRMTMTGRIGRHYFYYDPRAWAPSEYQTVMYGPQLPPG